MFRYFAGATLVEQSATTAPESPLVGAVERVIEVVTLSEAKDLLVVWHNGKQILRCAQNDKNTEYPTVRL